MESKDSNDVISAKMADEMLKSIEQRQDDFNKAIEGTTIGPILIMWGFLAFIGYIGTHLFLNYCHYIWIAIGVVGYPANAYLATFNISKKVRYRNEASKIRGKTVLVIWLLVVAVGLVSLFMLHTGDSFYSPEQMMVYPAFLVIVACFLIGLIQWDKRSMVFYVILSILLVAGHTFFAGLISLWLAFTFALPLFLAGIYLTMNGGSHGRD